MPNSSSLHRWHDILVTAIAPVIWGSTYIVTSEFLPPDRPFTAALIRVLPAGILLILFTRQFPSSKDFWKLIVLSALNIGLFQALLFVAAYRLPGGLAAVLGAIQPLIVMVLVWFWHPIPYVVIMDLSLPVMNFNLGPPKKASELNTSNLVNHNKTLILSVTTALLGTVC